MSYRTNSRRSSDTNVVLQFVVPSLVVVLLLGAGAVLLLRHLSASEAIRDAKQESRLAGEGIVVPALTDGVLEENPAALAAVDAAVRRHVLSDTIVRVKIWDRTGRIVYSDEPRLIGSRYPLGADETHTLLHGGVTADISDLQRPENRFERNQKKLLEVYLPVKTPDGKPLLFEAYLRYTSIAASAHRIWFAFGPAILAALILLELVQVPLALRYSRRLREAQDERERLFQRALDASDVERRRIAHDLHDGAVQSLSGVSFSLEAAAQQADDAALAGVLREGAAATRLSVRELRTLLVDIYPPDLHRAGLAAAIQDLLATLRGRGMETSVEIPAGLQLPPAVEELLFRVAQEALRNALAHSDADRVDVVVTDGRVARLAVTDDGKGFDAAQVGEQSFGLRLADDLVRDAGGTLTVVSSPGSGTTVSAEVPLP
jgi:two-component system NarL family sensor kinase